ncbi:glycerol-3-phosphate dehydrogenase [Oceanicola sp. 22II-s10i]|uniref:NAD(P)H-dependent glycerol-3-phosphate dehydrogenase n=1 Tax=Oceanicola sp. 22II-s10i TaxID=1317116 RepID=UPI000B521198|nr:NAD(P)H-dependent glycerol-3-phosphate dehydrogenase [Oceanicola sp. 22II-s10i]OWU85952.1 glycerol-3-phosphate dehydrogenase [Oceanicola sp. 22II-s10i]
MIAVMGAGAFGTALAVSIARGGEAVTLWARDADAVARMQADRSTPRLPGVELPETITATAETGSIPVEVPILLAVPMQKLREVATAHAAMLAGHPLVACCKGIELATGLGPSQVLAEVLPDATVALLTGPSFAADIARGLPTALTLACADGTVAEQLQKAIATPNLRLYRTDDVTGAETGGAMKNVIAIACGAAIGAGFGESARAAVMTRGYAEMVRLATRRGARAETLAGLSGLGDLALTCTSTQSRNYAFGLSLGRGETFDASITVEGAATARAVRDEAARQGIEMPITEVVTRLIDGALDMETALGLLLSRPLKEE